MALFPRTEQTLIFLCSGFGNLGGVISGFSFRSTDAPRFFQGHGLLIGLITMSFSLCLFMHLYLVRENARKDTDMERLGLTLESYSEDQKYQEREKGDNASVSASSTPNSTSLNHVQFFRYTV